MKKTFLTVLVTALLFSLSLTGCVFVAEDAGDLETKQFDFSGFTGVDISSAFEYEIVRADTYAVSITADSDLFKYIKVTQKGNMLKIGSDGFPYCWVWGRLAGLQATIAMPQLTELDISGAADGTVSGFASAEDLDIKLSGASSLEMTYMAAGNIDFEISGASEVEGDIKAGGDVAFDMSGASDVNADIKAGGDVDLDLSGASRLELQGSAWNMIIEASGASNLDLDSFAVHDAAVNLSGASNATIMPDGKLDADLSGSSQLYYIGEPVIGRFEISGGSDLSRKDS